MARLQCRIATVLCCFAGALTKQGETWNTISGSYESCDEKGNCVDDGANGVVGDSAIPPSDLVADRATQPWTYDEWKFARVKAGDDW